MDNLKFEIIINKYLYNNQIKDISVNGLQIYGKKIINKIITTVTINKSIIKKSIINNINTIIVHHGVLWKKQNITIINKLIINKLKKHKINLFAWHLPLDIHKKIGNNILLALKLNIKIIQICTYLNPYIIGINNNNIYNKLINKFKIFYFYNFNNKINKICICVGNGTNYIEQNIINYKIDTYITGEISERQIFLCKYYNVNLIILGHDISEQYGIKQLSIWIKNNLLINTLYIKPKNILLKNINNKNIYK